MFLLQYQDNTHRITAGAHRMEDRKALYSNISEWRQVVEKGIPGDRNNMIKVRCHHWGWAGELLHWVEDSSWRAVVGKNS